jgi:phenylpropionate dioxygenase-like ring-hydroxylating dioxygenase large terminal subunit
MNHAHEVSLLQECLELSRKQSPRLASRVQESPVSRYTDAARFAREFASIFTSHPIPVALCSELARDNDFVVRNSPWGSLIITRSAGGVKAFHNVCRHRGARLVQERQGCAERFQCPYHAWTYNPEGELIAVPHGKTAFPELQREERGLSELRCDERFGFIWVSPLDAGEKDDFFNEGFSRDLEWLAMDKLYVFASSTKTWRANWKLIAEGGLETYHFRFAHSESIAPFFLDNVAVADFFDLHTRTILPFATIGELEQKPEEEWSLRDSSHILYSIFPMGSFLVERDHVVWVQSRPIGVAETEITVCTLVPDDPKAMSDKARDYWQRNHDITVTVLDEDFLLGQEIQDGFASGANDTLCFGRNKGSLHLLNEKIERLLEFD